MCIKPVQSFLLACVVLAVCAVSEARAASSTTAATAAATTAAASTAAAFTVEVRGSGAPLILIPGLASSGAVWDGTVARYCGAQAAPLPRRQCHVLTLAGFAGVPAIDGPLLPAVTAQLSAYIARHQLNRPTVIGHSLGGFLALTLAAAHPQQVGRLVIVDSLPALGAAHMPAITSAQLRATGDAMRTQLLAQDAATFEASARQAVRTMVTGDRQAARIADWGARSDRRTVIEAMAELIGTDLRGDVARIAAPTLVVGSWIAYRDYANKAVYEQLYRSQYAQLAGARIELSDTARHFIMLDDPDWLYDRIDAFLD